MNSNQNILVKLNQAGFRIKDKWLVKGVSLQIEKGKIVTLIGPNGSGKSTTAKIALGIYKKIDGEVEKYTNKVGYVPQKISIDWTLPDLLVLDEPVQGVDFTGEIALYKLIKKITDELNCGILLISHDLHTVMSATDHVVCLNGHVCCSGSPIDVAKNNEYKALFGEQASQILSRYEHRHDHVHTSKGEIKKN
jgi:zinc transport system ATP-binding protein